MKVPHQAQKSRERCHVVVPSSGQGARWLISLADRPQHFKGEIVYPSRTSRSKRCSERNAVCVGRNLAKNLDAGPLG
jgi:hypothetical protein